MTSDHACATRINELLAEHNTELATGISFSTKPPRVMFQVATVKKNPTQRGKPVSMYASHCPFCGISLEAA